MFKRLQLESLFKIGFVKASFLLIDYLQGHLSKNRLGLILLRFTVIIYYCSLFILTLLVLSFFSIQINETLFLIALLAFFLVRYQAYSNNYLLNKDITSSLINKVESDEGFSNIPVNNKYIKSISYSNRYGDRILIKVEYKRKLYALKNANLFCRLTSKDFNIRFLGLDYHQKSLFLFTETNINKLDLLESLSNKQEEELNRSLRKVFGMNIANISPIYLALGDSLIVPSFGNPKKFQSRDWRFFIRKDKDINKINSFINTTLMTEKSAKSELLMVREKFSFIYSTAYFFQGLGIGNPWSWGHGWGRWNYILGSSLVNLIKGKHILDLGSNLGILPLYMLRSGANKVKGFELGKLEAETCSVYKDIMEWRDDKEYDLTVINSSMTEVMSAENENYDLVTAFCSLYYLQEQELEELLSWIYENIGTIVIQANEDSDVEGRQDLAQVEFLEKKVLEAGFKIIYKPKNNYNYPRPLFIAQS